MVAANLGLEMSAGKAAKRGLPAWAQPQASFGVSPREACPEGCRQASQDSTAMNPALCLAWASSVGQK